MDLSIAQYYKDIEAYKDAGSNMLKTYEWLRILLLRLSIFIKAKPQERIYDSILHKTVRTLNGLLHQTYQRSNFYIAYDPSYKPPWAIWWPRFQTWTSLTAPTVKPSGRACW